MPIPEFVVDLRRHVGHAPLWLTAASGVVLRSTGGVVEVLLVRRADTREWTVTAGIIDPGEEPAVAAEREVLEEAGVVCRVERLAWVYVEPLTVHANGDQTQCLELVFAASWVSGQARAADPESTDAHWFPVDDLPPTDRYQRARIMAALADGPAWYGHDEGFRRAGLS